MAPPIHVESAKGGRYVAGRYPGRAIEDQNVTFVGDRTGPSGQSRWTPKRTDIGLLAEGWGATPQQTHHAHKRKRMRT